MARAKLNKADVVKRLKEIYKQDGYLTVWNIRNKKMYYAVRKFWGSVVKMKKELGFDNGKTKERYVRLKKYTANIIKVYKENKRYHYNKTKIKEKLGYTFYFVKYSKHTEKIKDRLLKIKKRIGLKLISFINDIQLNDIEIAKQAKIERKLIQQDIEGIDPFLEVTGGYN